MGEELFPGRERVTARAVLAARRINLRGWEGDGALGVAPLVVGAGGGRAVLFRHGAAVFFGCAPTEEEALLSALGPRLERPYPEPEREEIEIVLRPGPERLGADGVLGLPALGVPEAQVVADALAKSVVLARYEGSLADAVDEVEPLAERLRGQGPLRVRSAELERIIGRALAIEHRMVGRAAIDEKPDALWERPDLERLYQRLDEEYELLERHRALDRKLELIARTVTTLLSLQYNRRTLRVEWLIVLLILVEVLLYLYELLH